MNEHEATEGRAVRARARLAGFLFLAVNAIYIAALLGSTVGPKAIRRPAVALQVIATAATITLAWSLYELVRPAGPGLALMALLFRVAEASIFGVLTVFSVLLLGGTSGPTLDDATRALVTQAQTASGQVGQIYFCPGSAIFFYLMMKGGFLPKPLAVFGLLATIVWLAAGLLQIGAPAVAGYLALSGPVFLLAETVSGIWLLYLGLRATPASMDAA
jgi:hypothetical protein